MSLLEREKIRRYFRILWIHGFYWMVLFLYDSWTLSACKKTKETGEPRKLLIVKQDAIGDYVLFRNYLEIVKKSQKYREYKITFCGNSLYRDIAEVFDGKLIDEFIWIERENFVKNRSYRRNILGRIRKGGYHATIQPTYSREFLWGDSLVRASGSLEKIGSIGDAANITMLQKMVSDRFFTKRLPAEKNVTFEFYRNREFFEQLLEERISTRKPFFPIQKNLQEKCVVIMPGAGSKFRQWKPEKFGAIADHIVQKHGAKIFVGGGRGDRIAGEIIQNIAGNENVENGAGGQTLSEFIAKVNNASLLITNETSAAHIGVAVDTETICVSWGNHLGRFNPYPEEMTDRIHYVFPPMGKKMRHDVNDIEIESVLDAVDAVLE